MKISHPLAIRGSAMLLGLWLRSWMCATRLHEEFPQSIHPLRAQGAHLYVFWHENLMLAAHAYASPGVSVLISRHRDGELIAQIVTSLGGAAIRGSSTHGGARAIRQMLAEGRQRHLAITPDGPRGPRRVLQRGSVFVASELGIPIVPVGMAAKRGWRMRSWDRLVIAGFASSMYVVAGEPLHVPPAGGREELEKYRVLAQAALDRAQAAAEARAGC